MDSLHKNYLEHHGILNQKWGRRNGPPYPLDKEDHSAAEKKTLSKSLTGKRHKEMYDRKNSSPKKAKYSDVQKDFEAAINNKKDVYDRIITNGSKMSDMANETGEVIRKSYKTAKLSKQQKDAIEKKLHDDFGVGCDDELYDMILEEYISEELDNSISKEAKDKYQEFNKFQEDYWNDVHSITSEILEKYKDTKITDNNYYNDGFIAVNNLTGDILNTSFNSYISRHFDDYWTGDTEERYDAIERLKKEFSMDVDAYNKKYGKS